MGVVVEIPSALKQYVNNQDEVEVQGSSIEEAFGALCSKHTELKKNLFDENGQIRSFINVYLNDDDIRYADGIKSEVQDGDTIQIVPSIAGGC
ncbi:MAG: MoaD/ThiS family protein [SAR324 cluster bacterium]|jgi:molybdopterin converting factor small subunit|nr:MoaD/ThiS family protein [SAR324 cluster bacterium]MCH2266739.1 MoaD/ThiS family protein [SAR324 cluster bacterium]